MSAKIRRRTMLPSPSSSIAWMYIAKRVLATYSVRSSGENASPFGYSKSAIFDDRAVRLYPVDAGGFLLALGERNAQAGDR